MFVCLDCDYLFEEPGMHCASDEFERFDEDMCNGCPCCGGAYIETFKCDICGEWITGDYAEAADGTLICEECY